MACRHRDLLSAETRGAAPTVPPFEALRQGADQRVAQPETRSHQRRHLAVRLDGGGRDPGAGPAPPRPNRAAISAAPSQSALTAAAATLGPDRSAPATTAPRRRAGSPRPSPNT